MGRGGKAMRCRGKAMQSAITFRSMLMCRFLLSVASGERITRSSRAKVSVERIKIGHP